MNKETRIFVWNLIVIFYFTYHLESLIDRMYILGIDYLEIIRCVFYFAIIIISYNKIQKTLR